MPKRIRRDHPNYELRHARVRVARRTYECVWCPQKPYLPDVRRMQGSRGVAVAGLNCEILVGDVYARISETRLPVCSAHFTLDDITETDK